MASLQLSNRVGAIVPKSHPIAEVPKDSSAICQGAGVVIESTMEEVPEGICVIFASVALVCEIML